MPKEESKLSLPSSNLSSLIKLLNLKLLISLIWNLPEERSFLCAKIQRILENDR